MSVRILPQFSFLHTLFFFFTSFTLLLFIWSVNSLGCGLKHIFKMLHLNTVIKTVEFIVVSFAMPTILWFSRNYQMMRRRNDDDMYWRRRPVTYEFAFCMKMTAFSKRRKIHRKIISVKFRWRLSLTPALP